MNRPGEQPHGSQGPSRMLLSVAADVSRVAARHAPALRSAGLDEIAERLEELVRVLAAGAQELEAAMQELPRQVVPR